jgi:hypothetical protein
MSEENKTIDLDYREIIDYNNLDEPIYVLAAGIKIYDGTTLRSRQEYANRIKYFNDKTTIKIFTPLQPSTLTAQGCMSNVSFIEENTIDMLTEPTGNIISIGCNFGKKFIEGYEHPEVKKSSGKGRKKKIKKERKRKVQGTGEYFNSCIQFVIKHSNTSKMYKVKLFRNGVFQVPGVNNPNMLDLVDPACNLHKYLLYNFKDDIKITDFTAVMRNYKASLINKNYHINLEKLEEIILREKINPKYERFIDHVLEAYTPAQRERVKDMLGNYNPLNIAEITYNTDRCFSLIIKFHRPSISTKDKKMTVKLLKKGKINFDGGNSEQEVKELYAWLEQLYARHHDEISFDIRDIQNVEDPNTSDCSEPSIYDNDQSDEEPEVKTIDPRDIIMNAVRKMKAKK